MIQIPTSCISFVPLRAILMSIMCDLPASRKVCGFTNGLKGCSKFFKEFMTVENSDKLDYSGYDCDSWIA